MIGFFTTVGVLALLAVVVWAAYRIWEAFETIDQHDRKIDEAAIDIKSYGRRLDAIDKELISIHQSILRLNLDLEEAEREMNDKDLEAAGR